MFTNRRRIPPSCESSRRSYLFYIQPWPDVTITRAAPRGQKTDTFDVEGGSTQHTSFDANGVVARTNDKSTECSTPSEEQVIQEYKTAAPKCEAERSLAQPSWTPTLQERTAVVVSPQVNVNVQQTVTVEK